MGIFRIILTVLFVLVCIALTVVVLMQEGKSSGLGAIAGGNSFWEQNKGRSAEGKLTDKSTPGKSEGAFCLQGNDQTLPQAERKRCVSNARMSRQYGK